MKYMFVKYKIFNGWKKLLFRDNGMLKNRVSFCVLDLMDCKFF